MPLPAPVMTAIFPWIESFNGRLREESLNAHWFLSLDDARRKIEAWRVFYNEARPDTRGPRAGARGRRRLASLRTTVHWRQVQLEE